MSKNDEFMLPSDPEDVKRFRGMIEEISAQEQMIKDRKENINEVKAEIKANKWAAPTMVTQLVKAVDDDAYIAMTTATSQFELMRESLFGDGGLPDDNAEA